MHSLVPLRRQVTAIARLVAIAFVVVAHAGTIEVPLQIGAGCNHSDYSSLPTSSNGTDGPAAFHFQYDGGLGVGLYVLHVSDFKLPRDDIVRIRPKDATADSLSVALAGRNTSGDFFTKAVAANGVVVELFKSAGSTVPDGECLGFSIDKLLFTPEADAKKVAVGDDMSIEALSEVKRASNTSSDSATEINESLCGADESQEAACYANGSVEGGASMYASSRAVARLVIRKDSNFNIAYCTGFLLGCEGHLITNQHCIRSWIDALNTAVEFYAETSQCGSQECLDRSACQGRIRVRSVTLVVVSTQYDYALVKLTPDDGSPASSLLSQVGGYLQLRGSGPKMDEHIFIPQYPLGYGKRIASTANGEPGRVDSLSVSTCGGSDVGYNVDTQEGSSGSPVIASSDGLVIALHHCGGCPNGAIPSTQLIADMTQRGVLPSCAVA